MEKPKLVIVGGFLGAGKTTLLSVAAKALKLRNLKVGIITNDQATGLVDTHVLGVDGFDVEEVSGSCFCCDFTGFVRAIDTLISSHQCEVVLAEPVGSCTDLSATLVQPLKAYYGTYIDIAPLSVMADALKLQKYFNSYESLLDGSGYIYLKQLEEADYILINKTDLLSGAHMANINILLHERFKDYAVRWLCAKTEIGVEEWLKEVMTDKVSGKNLAQVDYDTYAVGEAQMGWYNATLKIEHLKIGSIDWMAFNKDVLILFQELFGYEKVIVAHLKILIKNASSHVLGNIVDGNEISLDGNNFYDRSVRMVLNIRAEASHLLICELVDEILNIMKEREFTFEFISKKHFAPSYPRPTYRHYEVFKNS
ncbi:MAG: GTP-binding protein [Sediminicola sp.]|tara:strand:+ start:18780 stop:19883 length:1104 start_codon:yes stop_codon:yes gene_type:complete